MVWNDCEDGPGVRPLLLLTCLLPQGLIFVSTPDVSRTESQPLALYHDISVTWGRGSVQEDKPEGAPSGSVRSWGHPLPLS